MDLTYCSRWSFWGSHLFFCCHLLKTIMHIPIPQMYDIRWTRKKSSRQASQAQGITEYWRQVLIRVVKNANHLLPSCRLHCSSKSVECRYRRSWGWVLQSKPRVRLSGLHLGLYLCLIALFDHSANGTEYKTFATSRFSIHVECNMFTDLYFVIYSRTAGRTRRAVHSCWCSSQHPTTVPSEFPDHKKHGLYSPNEAKIDHRVWQGSCFTAWPDKNITIPLEELFDTKLVVDGWSYIVLKEPWQDVFNLSISSPSTKNYTSPEAPDSMRILQLFGAVVEGPILTTGLR